MRSPRTMDEEMSRPTTRELFGPKTGLGATRPAVEDLQPIQTGDRVLAYSDAASQWCDATVLELPSGADPNFTVRCDVEAASSVLRTRQVELKAFIENSKVEQLVWAKTCPFGHKMLAWLDPDPDGSVDCARCSRGNIRAPEHFYRCTTCKFYACKECINQPPTVRLRPSTMDSTRSDALTALLSGPAWAGWQTAGVSRRVEAHLARRGFEAESISSLGDCEATARRHAEQVLMRQFDDADINAVVEAWKLAKDIDWTIGRRNYDHEANTDVAGGDAAGGLEQPAAEKQQRVTEEEAARSIWRALSDVPTRSGLLKAGARVREIETAGHYLHFEKIEGDGPAKGWVSIVAQESKLMEKEAYEDRALLSEPFALANVTMEDLRPRTEPRQSRGLTTASFLEARRQEQQCRLVSSRDFEFELGANVGESFASRMQKAYDLTRGRMLECQMGAKAAAARPQENVNFDLIRRSVDAARAERDYVKTLSPRRPMFCDDVVSKK